mgnify:CR=1 FL=1|jgi:hypothetical protein
MILSVGIDALFILIGTLPLKKTLLRALQSLYLQVFYYQLFTY